MPKEIPLTRGYVAIVDDEDFERLSKYHWCIYTNPRSPSPYALRSTYRDTGQAGSVYMHRDIMGAGAGVQVDHINGDGLDNRRANLRICTPAENGRNRRKLAPTSSRYKGVNRRARSDHWRARIRVNGVLVHLGDFATEEAAAKAYDMHARKAFGEFANLNFPLLDPASVTTARDIRKARTGSLYRGVTYRPKSGRWQARITVNRKLIQLGVFATQEEAARVYDAAATRLHGASAYLNFPPMETAA